LINFSEEGLILAISYFIPGFLISMMLINALYLEKSNGTLTIYKYLVFSLVNIFFYKLIDRIYYYFVGDYLFKSESLVSLLRNIVLPIIISISIISLLKATSSKTSNDKQSILYRLLRKIKLLLCWLGIDKASITSNSWDYIFYELKYMGGGYMIVKLKNGEEIYGLFSSKSFASSGKKDGENDLFLEETYNSYKFDESNNTGVYIRQSDIISLSTDFSLHSQNNE